MVSFQYLMCDRLRILLGGIPLPRVD
jgi:hypothetical protein